EALRLGGGLAGLMPDEPEVHGLHALMLLHDARSAARLQDGELVLLEHQDRALWNDTQVAAGRAALARANALGGGGAYTLQAGIASLHADVPRDWRAVARLYDELAAVTGSPVVELNRAVAGPAAGLRIVERLDLDGYRYFHSTRADLLRRLDRFAEARTAYEQAYALAATGAERRFLERRIAECADRARP